MPDSNPDVVPLTAPPPAPTRGPVAAVLRYLVGSIPTLMVLAGIAGVAWYGLTHDWKFPKFSELRGEEAEKDDWCKEHAVAKSICVECDPELLPPPPKKGWCKIHGVAECVLCNPELAQLPTVPTITAADLKRAAEGLAANPLPKNNPACLKHRHRFQFASIEEVAKAGIETHVVGTGDVTEGFTAAAELGYDQTRVAHLSARAPGSVWKVFKRLGQSVKAGEVLALVEAAEVGKAKAEILSAFATIQLRQQALAALRETGVTAPARIRDATAAVREAEIRLTAANQALTNLGLPFDDADTAGVTTEQLKAKLLLRGIPPEVAAGIDRRTASANLLPVIAPMDALVVSRDVVAGEVVDPTRVLFELVDTRNLWLTLDVRGEDAPKVELGQTVRFSPDHGGPVVEAKINWRSTQVDPKTRTLKVRADVPDPTGKLLANTFGTATVVLRERKGVVAVPPEAVQTDGDCQIVFVREKGFLKKTSPKVFLVRKVRVGVRDGVRMAHDHDHHDHDHHPGDEDEHREEKGTEITAGLLPGEVVVTKGSAALLFALEKRESGEAGEEAHGHSH